MQNKILIIEDTEATVYLLEEYLKEIENNKIFVATNGKDGVKLANKIKPDLILLDIGLPFMDGYEACKLINNNKQTKDIPVIFLTAYSQSIDKVKAFKAGGVDYLTKPFKKEELIVRIKAHLKISKLQKELQISNLQLEEKNQALIKSEQRFKAIADYSYDWEDWIDIDGKLLWVNKAVESITGYTSTEYLQMPEGLQKVIFSKDTKRIMSLYQNGLNKQQSVNDIEFRIVKKDGTLIWASVSFQPIYSLNKDYLGIRSSIRDISKRKKAEKELLKAKQKAEKNEKKVIVQNKEIELNNERLESIFRISQLQTKSIKELFDYTLNEAIKLTKSKIGYFFFYDEKTHKFSLYSWSKEVTRECSISNPQCVYDLDKTKYWNKAIQQKKPIIINNHEQYNKIKKELPKDHVKLSKSLTIPIFDGNNITAVIEVANKNTDYNKSDIRQLTLLMNYAMKISEKITLIDNLKIAKEKAENSEKELNHTKQYLENLINNAHAPIIVWNTNFEIQLFNTAFERLTGYTSNNIINKTLDFLIPHANIIETKEKIRLATLVNTRETIEIPILCKNDEIKIILCNSANIYDTNNKTLISTITQGQDITARIETEKQVFNAIVHAEEKERTHFARELHDGLGPLMSTLKIFMQGIQRVNDTNKIKEFTQKAHTIFNEILQTITEVSNNLSPHILHKFGLYTGLKSFIEKNAKHSGINFVFDYNHKQFKNAICKKTNKNCELSSRMSEIYEITIYRIITELINNSIKHSNADKISIIINKKDHCLYINYTDNGIGFNYEKVLNNNIGMGLYNMQNRMKNINGTIIFGEEGKKGFSAQIIFKCRHR